MTAPAIQLESVVKRFGTTVAVDGVSLSVEQGEVFAFVGPNGAGKTTTIKMMAGLLRCDAGEVRVCGQDMSENGLAAKRSIAWPGCTACPTGGATGPWRN